MFYKSYPLSKLANSSLTKGELASIMGIEGVTFDYALPQEWLTDFANTIAERKVFEDYTRDEVYQLVLSTTFWVYPKGSAFGFAACGCSEVAQFLPNAGCFCRWQEEDFAA